MLERRSTFAQASAYPSVHYCVASLMTMRAHFETASSPFDDGGRARSPLSLLADENAPLLLQSWVASETAAGVLHFRGIQLALCAAQAKALRRRRSRRRCTAQADGDRIPPDTAGGEVPCAAVWQSSDTGCSRAAGESAAAAASSSALVAHEKAIAAVPEPETPPTTPPSMAPTPSASPALGHSVQAELLRLERRRVAEAQAEAAALRARLMRAEALVRELRAAVAAARGGGGVDGALRQVATHIPPTPISFPPAPPAFFAGVAANGLDGP